MNNKKLGTDWEQKFVDDLASKGYWVHFITPDKRGAQPFDVIACRNGIPQAYDCKTCADKWFSIDRLEQNQIMAFEKWLRCGNPDPHLAVLHNEKVYIISYNRLKLFRRLRLNDDGSTSTDRNRIHK